MLVFIRCFDCELTCEKCQPYSKTTSIHTWMSPSGCTRWGLCTSRIQLDTACFQPSNLNVFSWFQYLLSICQIHQNLHSQYLYRYNTALVTAKKDKTTTPDEPERAMIASDVYAVKEIALDGAAAEEFQMYPKANNRQNFCYFCVDPWKRHVTVWYHGYRPYW
jgi:hypothetical protein